MLLQLKPFLKTGESVITLHTAFFQLIFCYSNRYCRVLKFYPEQHHFKVTWKERETFSAQQFQISQLGNLKDTKWVKLHINKRTNRILKKNQLNNLRVEDRQSRIAWQTVKEVSRGKSTAKAKLKANSSIKKKKRFNRKCMVGTSPNYQRKLSYRKTNVQTLPRCFNSFRSSKFPWTPQVTV